MHHGTTNAPRQLLKFTNQPLHPPIANPAPLPTHLPPHVPTFPSKSLLLWASAFNASKEQHSNHIAATAAVFIMHCCRSRRALLSPLPQPTCIVATAAAHCAYSSLCATGRGPFWGVRRWYNSLACSTESGTGVRYIGSST